ncbi:hypothetical protein PCS_02610 [Desulfocurvibacter africanus PCS]|uniref:HicB-like antitoxin of toxin-antitoxin system domain-containing protein n=1 Tax=Desulfocurvibacter africanus PCS TaxID=1262666 RepID=M5Q1J1_DESAF|nr:type II toxin-antitoxin system HicB family antitoxin [Desulfocurvibacter africanus]EMG36598.1 hypothetical protein PCS_02610 [Desulfocurvibacter africanus PCS]
MATYIAVIHKESDSEYGVCFPDFPGCISAGVDLDEAATMAREALALHVAGMIEDGEALPVPSGLEEARQSDLAEGAVAFMAIDLADKPSRAVRVNITLPEDLLSRVDKAAETRGMSRSGLLAAAAREYITQA